MCGPNGAPQHGESGSLRHETAFNRLSPELEQDFQRDMQFAPGWSDWRRDFIKNVGKPPNIDPGGDYNYRLAWLSGKKPELDPGTGEVHGFSTVELPPFKEPVELKAINHPTMWKEDFMQRFRANPDLVAQGVEQKQPGMDQYASDLIRRYSINQAIGGQ